MTSHVNISKPERWVSTLGGAALAAAGLKRLIEDDRARGAMLTAAGAGLFLRGATGHCHVYDAAGVDTSGNTDTRVRLGGDRGINVEESMTINALPEDLYCQWRDFECLPLVFPNLTNVELLGNGRSRWVARGPAGKRVEWIAEIINEIPGELLAWRSVGSPAFVNAGSVNFKLAPGARGTIVRVRMQYDTAAGKLGAAFARLFGRDPAERLREGLRRFKQMIEAGEIPTSEYSLRGAQ